MDDVLRVHIREAPTWQALSNGLDMHRHTLSIVLSLTVIGLVVGARPTAGADRIPSLRTSDPLLAEALDTGRTRSATFRHLLTRLETSNLIVHLLRRGGPWTTSPRGFTQFIAMTGGYRFVQVTITSAHTATHELVALVGHELQHVVEVAEARAVVDPDTYHDLYRAIGYPSCRSRRCFDTPEAVAVGSRVLAELSSFQSLENRGTNGY